MNNQAKAGPINKKQALVLFTLFDFLGIIAIWLGYDNLKEYFFGIDNHTEVIKFSSREGFFTAGIIIPIIHIVGIIEYFHPKFIKKHMKAANLSGIIAIIVFLFSSFFISSWMRSNIENNGYVYCRHASGVSALVRTLVYTKNMDICEELVESKKKRRR